MELKALQSDALISAKAGKFFADYELYCKSVGYSLALQYTTLKSCDHYPRCKVSMIFDFTLMSFVVRGKVVLVMITFADM